METKDMPIVQDSDISEKEIPQSFDHHILLYSKNWYKKSGDVIADLRILLAEYAGLTIELVSEISIKECLADCWTKYCPEFEKGKALQEMLGWTWHHYHPSWNRTPERIMIGTLANAEGKYVDPSKLLPVLVKEHTELGKEMIQKCKETIKLEGRMVACGETEE